MIRWAVAGVSGLAVGVLVMLFVSASVDSRTARETRLEEQVAELETQVREVETARDKAIAAAEVKLNEAQKASQVKDQQHAAESKQWRDQVQLLTEVIAEIKVHEAKPLAFTLDDMLDAVRKEFAVVKGKSDYVVAGGKVMIMPVTDSDGVLRSVDVYGNQEALAEFCRTFFLMLYRVEGYRDDKITEIGIWLAKAIALTSKESESSVRRRFGKLTVDVAYFKTAEKIDIIRASFGAKDKEK